MRARFEIAHDLFKGPGIKRRDHARTARDVGRPNGESSPTSVWYALETFLVSL